MCDQTQEPRKVNIYYHCNNVNNNNPAFLEAAQETSEKCSYYYTIASTLACVPQNSHNANCQWRRPDGNGGYYYLDLSELKGKTVHAPLGTNGYEIYTSICSNNLHCYQQHQSSVMSVIDNRQTNTCEHSLAVWEEGQGIHSTHTKIYIIIHHIRIFAYIYVHVFYVLCIYIVQPLLHQNSDPKQTHWTFHYWNGQTCSNGQQGEEKIRFFCDPDVEEYKVMGTYGEGNCIFDMNISTKMACLDQEPRWVDAEQVFN